MEFMEYLRASQNFRDANGRVCIQSWWEDPQTKAEALEIARIAESLERSQKVLESCECSGILLIMVHCPVSLSRF